VQTITRRVRIAVATRGRRAPAEPARTTRRRSTNRPARANRRRTVGVVSAALVAALALGTSRSGAAGATSAPAASSSVFTVQGFAAPGTPPQYNQVMVRRFGSANASKVLVLVPGDLGGAGDFNIVGPYLAAHVPGLQVWAETRREGALEDNSVLLRARHGTASLQDAFNYYLGWIDNPAISPHYQPLNAKQYGFVDQWGLDVAMEDLHAVILQARDHGHRTVILGGHSLGGAEAAIYPTWDFNGHGGYQDIAGIIGIDGGALGGTGAGITTVPQAQAALQTLTTKGPWQDLLGLGLPWVAGAFAELGALNASKAPNGPSIQQQFPLLPAEFKPSVPVTNLAQLGYAFDASTSPAALALIHVHSGHLAATGTPRGWVNDGPTPAQNIASAFLAAWAAMHFVSARQAFSFATKPWISAIASSCLSEGMLTPSSMSRSSVARTSAGIASRFASEKPSNPSPAPWLPRGCQVFTLAMSRAFSSRSAACFCSAACLACSASAAAVSRAVSWTCIASI